MIRPLSFYDHNDPQTWYRQDEFVFGDHILVCPVLEPDRQGRRLYLPKGKWYHYFSDSLHIGGKEHYVDTPLNQIPVFIKAGAIIPMQASQQYVGEHDVEQIELHVYQGTESEQSELYEDQGDGHGHKQGYYLNKSFTVLPTDEKYRITQHQQGRMKATYEQYEMVFHGFDKLPKSIEVDSEAFTGKAISDAVESNIFRIKIPEGFKQITLRWV